MLNNYALSWENLQYGYILPGDTSLVILLVDELAKKRKWTYEKTMDKFYNSAVCKYLSDRETGYYTFAPREIIELFEEEEKI